MKKYLIIITVFLCCAGEAGAADDYWLMQPKQTSQNLSSCVFTDTLNGWIAGDSGLIINTRNNGLSWEQQFTGITNNIIELFFLNGNVGYALSWVLDATPPNYYGTKILTTINGGQNWNVSMFPDSNVFLNTVFFRDSLNGYLAGSGGKLYYTSDGGADWLLAPIDSGIDFGFPVNKISFYDENYGLAVGGAIDIAGVVWKSTNGGRSWRTIVVGPEPINDFLFLDKNNAVGVGGDFEYGSSQINSSDMGSNWLYEEFQVFGIANTIAYRTPEEGWISLGIVDSFLVTTNGGQNWNLTGTPQQSNIYDITFSSNRNGWAVGNNGVILKYNSSLVSVNNLNSVNPESFILQQNYPNPFNPKTVINYELRVTSNAKLRVFDVLGNEVAELVNEKQNAGSYSVEFDGSGFASGIYFYKLTAGEFSETKRMILLK
ncbi:MAG: YCF48-related protein [Ignavibacteria bacterium]